jgi:hypothetical protein
MVMALMILDQSMMLFQGKKISYVKIIFVLMSGVDLFLVCDQLCQIVTVTHRKYLYHIGTDMAILLDNTKSLYKIILFCSTNKAQETPYCKLSTI